MSSLSGNRRSNRITDFQETGTKRKKELGQRQTRKLGTTPRGAVQLLVNHLFDIVVITKYDVRLLDMISVR